MKTISKLDTIIIENYETLEAQEIITKFKLLTSTAYIGKRATELRKKYGIPKNKRHIKAVNMKKLDDYIVNNYNIQSIDDIKTTLNITAPAQYVRQRAHRLAKRNNIKLTKRNKYNFFDRSLESFYWIGFLLADAHFQDRKSITIGLSSKDLSHLEKFMNFIKSDNNIAHYTVNLNNKQYKSIKVQISDDIHIPTICDEFNITNNKSIIPPIIFSNNMSDDQFMALAIGYIDGDGCITSNSIRLNAHKSWLTNFITLENNIKRIIGIPNNRQLSRLDSRNYALLIFSNSKILKYLKVYADTNNLPILSRKWNNLAYSDATNSVLIGSLSSSTISNSPNCESSEFDGNLKSSSISYDNVQ